MKLIRALWFTLKDHPYQSTVVLLFVIWMVSVRTYNMFQLSGGEARISGLLETPAELNSGSTAKELLEAKYFAAMSAEVYRLQHNNDGKTDHSKCRLDNYLKEHWERLPHPRLMPTRPKVKKDDQGYQVVQGEQTRLDGDLVYGIWYRTRPDDGKKQIALVFRGTHTLHSYGDWWSNARWITKWIPFTGWDQYDLTRTVAHYVTTDLVGKTPELDGYENAEFIAAGHSLGGGQAQQAGYAASAIKRVYSFNGSSVTGFYSVEKSKRNINKQGMRIFRIGERGEVLAILRGIMRAIYPVVEKNPKIVEVTYNFGDFGFFDLVKQHSMDDLACELVGS